MGKSGIFDRKLESYYQSDADFQYSIALWNKFPQKETTMPESEIRQVREWLPEVTSKTLSEIKSKCSLECKCGRVHTAYDLIKFCLDESIHGAHFLTSIFNENRQDKKISIMDSVHKGNDLPDSVVWLDDTKEVPCSNCKEDIHLYLLSSSLAHYWNGG